jgi:hypothetical protein
VATFLRGRFFRKQRRFFLPALGDATAPGATITITASMQAGVATSSAWTPADLGTPNSAQWDIFDSTKVTQAGGTISQVDNSGTLSSLALTQATGSKQPTYTAGGAVFDGSTDTLGTSSVGYTSLYSGGDGLFYAVVAYTSGTKLFSWNVSSSNRMGLEGDGRFDWGDALADGIMIFSGATLSTSYKILTVVKTATTSAAYINGTQVDSQSNTTTPSSSTNIWLGTNDGINLAAACAFRAVGFIDDATTDTRERVEGRLAHYLGLTAGLPSDHTYKSTPPLAGTNGTASGSTITVTASVVVGTATGAATAAASTPTVTASLVAGTATGAATAAGATITATASMVAGSASAGVNGTATGATITTTATLVAGTATGNATAAGSTISVTASMEAGTAEGGSAAAPIGLLLAHTFEDTPAAGTGSPIGLLLALTFDESAVAAAPAQRGDGGGQGDHRRSKRIQDPRSAIERLIARFRAAQAALKGDPEATPAPVKTAVTAARRAPEGDLLAPFAPALGVEWDAVVADMAARDADMQAITARALEVLEAIEQAQDEDDEEVMLLLAA